jgi:hypothetical protein
VSRFSSESIAMADDGNTTEPWTLTLADRASVMTKYGANRLRFALILLFPVNV